MKASQLPGSVDDLSLVKSTNFSELLGTILPRVGLVPDKLRAAKHLRDSQLFESSRAALRRQGAEALPDNGLRGI